MQLIVRHEIESYDAWRAAFDDDAEDRAQAGLNLLQIWREAGASAVWLLYEVSDRERAQAYFDGLAQVHARQGGVRATERHFVRTA